MAAIEELGVQQDGDFGPDVAHEQCFAPAAVTDNQVRRVSFLPENQQRIGDGGGARCAGGVVGGEGVAVSRVGLLPFVGAHGDNRRAAIVGGDDGQEVVFAGRFQGGGDVEELAGEVLVEEEDLHRRFRTSVEEVVYIGIQRFCN